MRTLPDPLLEFPFALLLEAGASTAVWKNNSPQGTLLRTAVLGAAQRRVNAAKFTGLSCTRPPLEHYLAIMELLVSSGIKADASSPSSFTPLATACHDQFYLADSIQIVKRLLELGASPNAGSPAKPLHCVVTFSPELVRLLMDKGADPNSVWDNLQKPAPLHLVAWRNQTESARLLLEHGAKMDALDAEAHTPLFLAVSFGSIDMIRLLATKANLEARNESDRRLTALHLAASEGKLDLIRSLTAAGADPTASTGLLCQCKSTEGARRDDGG